MAMALIASSWTLTPKEEAQERRLQPERVTEIRGMRSISVTPLK